MKPIDPDPGAFSEALKTLPKDKPVVMLNLLAFRDQAAYEADSEESSVPCSGREAYARYSKLAIKHVAGCGGQVIFMGAAQAPKRRTHPHTPAALTIVQSKPAKAVAPRRPSVYTVASVSLTMSSHG